DLEVGSHKLFCRAHELLVETAERRTTVAGDITCSVQAGAPVTLFLHQAGTNQRLITCDKYVRLAQVVFVVEADRSKRHGWPCLRGAQGARSPSYRLVLSGAKRLTAPKSYTPTGLEQICYYRYMKKELSWSGGKSPFGASKHTMPTYVEVVGRV